RRSHRRTEALKGTPPEDGVQTGRPHPSRRGVACVGTGKLRDRASRGHRPCVLAGKRHLERRALPATVDRGFQGARELTAVHSSVFAVLCSCSLSVFGSGFRVLG